MLPRHARLAILNPAFIDPRVAEAQLMREACVLETLQHSGVPRVLECGVHDRRLWVASEYIAGRSIEQVAAQRPLPISDALAVVRDAAAILAHAHHRGVVHRGLTPSSVVQTADSGSPSFAPFQTAKSRTSSFSYSSSATRAPRFTAERSIPESFP